MDVILARTFLEVLTAGSFQSAANRLFVTQSAVSLRIKKLEEELGREVFTRNKGGAVLTPAGEQFERFARSIVKLWEEARYQVAIPPGLDSLLIIGCQYSLWPRLGMNWLRMMEAQMPRTALKAEIGKPDGLLRMMLDGLLDIGVMYTPQLRPGLQVKPLMEDTLILVSTDPQYSADLDERYVSIDWSPEFLAQHAVHYPNRAKSNITLALGSMSVRYVIGNNRAAYFPARAIEEFVKAGQLHIVSDAPAFPFPCYVVWNPDKDPVLVKNALDILARTVADVDRKQLALIEEAGISDIGGGLSERIFH